MKQTNKQLIIKGLNNWIAKELNPYISTILYKPLTSSIISNLSTLSNKTINNIYKQIPDLTTSTISVNITQNINTISINIILNSNLTLTQEKLIISLLKLYQYI